MKIKPLIIKARYYETDKMGIIHHSNYIRWFEEARVDVLEQLGLGYDKLESMGIISPVLTMNCKYIHPVLFNEEVEITANLVSFTGVRLEVYYEIKKTATGQICTTGSSTHGFIDNNGKPIRIKKQFPDIYEIIINSIKD